MSNCEKIFGIKIDNSKDMKIEDVIETLVELKRDLYGIADNGKKNGKSVYKIYSYAEAVEIAEHELKKAKGE